MARPTRDEIIQFLRDIGLPQVDPSSWFDGTLPEILRAMVDFGRIKPMPVLTFIQNTLFTSGVNVDESFDFTGANAGTIRVIKNVTISMITANITTLNARFLRGPLGFAEKWVDPGGAFPLGQYIGGDTDRTLRWNSMGLNNIVMYPPELTQGVQEQFNIQVFSAAPAVKSFRIQATIVEFDSRDFPGGLW